VSVSVTGVEETSFEGLYRRHGAEVLRLCRLLLRDPDEARDVAQDVVVKLLRECQAGRPVLGGRWLRQVTLNACRDRRRSAWWRWWGRDGVALDEGTVVGRGGTPEDIVLGREVREEIWAIFRRLSTRQREVFALRHVEELSTAEVAASLGISEGSAKRHLYRAVRELRAALGGHR